MTLAEQITALKGKYTESEQIDPAILLRVLDSMNAALEAQQKRMVEFGGTMSAILEKIGTLAEKVPYRDPHVG